MSDEEVERYHHFKNKGKELAAEGDIELAIEYTEKAYRIHASDRLRRRIEKMKDFLKQIQDEDDDNPDVSLGEGFLVPGSVFKELYSYQKDGIRWLWALHRRNKGGILGDDMGLGKTIQIISFLCGAFGQGHIRHALIIMPVSLIVNWCNEFQKWAPGLNVETFHSDSKSQRERNLVKIQRSSGVLITSYGMVVTNVDLFEKCRGKQFVWDYVILDEGHKIKNPTKTTKAVHQLPAKHRLVLTGTPIQNNLRELWALYDFCHQGTLLGSLPTFKLQFETIIIRSREKNATSGEKKLGNVMADKLRELIAPYFLRRTKQEVLRRQEENGNGDKENRDPQAFDSQGKSKKMSKLPQKNDFIVWLHLSETQIQIYDDFLKTDHIKDLLMTKKSPLVALTVLKKICDHPRLLSVRACLQLGMNGEIGPEEMEEILQNEETCAPSIDVDHDLLLKESGKLSVLINLLMRLKEEGHKTLVFSQSRKLLDIIYNILIARNWNILRLDGTIKKLDEREKIVRQFQNGKIYQIMLLTTQVGGVGLTLTAADRVIIYDPSWNPATDSQAVDRAYRIGQVKPVVVYRLITCGTVEEKIYRRQIFKDSITRKTMGASKDPHRYFTNMELKELFRLDDPTSSSTQLQLQEMHSHNRAVYPELLKHLDFLHTLDIFGISDHDLMFQGNLNDPDLENTNSAQDQEYIRTRVEKAQLLLQLESEEAHNENLRSGAFCKDLTNFQKSRPTIKIPDPMAGDFAGPSEYSLTPDERVDYVKDESVIEVSNSSDASLTEEEIVELKNLSMNDPTIAQALDAYEERLGRISVKIESQAASGSVDVAVENKVEPEIIALDNVKTGVDDELELALKLSLLESQTASHSKCHEDEDFARAVELSLLDLKLSENNVNDEEDDEDTKRALEMSLAESQALTNLSHLDNDFAEALEMSLRESCPSAAKEKLAINSPVYFNARSSSGSSKHGHNSLILAVDSDLEDSEPSPTVSFKNLNHLDETVPDMSLPNRPGPSFSASKSRSFTGKVRRSCVVVDETDDEDVLSDEGNKSESFIHAAGRRRKHRILDSSAGEESSVGSETSSSSKRSRLSIEDETLDRSVSPSGHRVSSAQVFERDSRLDDPLPDLEESDEDCQLDEQLPEVEESDEDGPIGGQLPDLEESDEDGPINRQVRDDEQSLDLENSDSSTGKSENSFGSSMSGDFSFDKTV